MAVVLDSDAVIGFLAADDALHEPAVERLRELLEQGEAAHVSAVTYAEVLTGAVLGHHAESEVRGFFGDVVAKILPVDEAVAEQAAELRARNRALRMPDALILACAELEPDVSRILSGDERTPKVKGLSCRIERLAG